MQLSPCVLSMFEQITNCIHFLQLSVAVSVRPSCVIYCQSVAISFVVESFHIQLQYLHLIFTCFEGIFVMTSCFIVLPDQYSLITPSTQDDVGNIESTILSIAFASTIWNNAMERYNQKQMMCRQIRIHRMWYQNSFANNGELVANVRLLVENITEF